MIPKELATILSLFLDDGFIIKLFSRVVLINSILILVLVLFVTFVLFQCSMCVLFPPFIVVVVVMFSFFAIRPS